MTGRLYGRKPSMMTYNVSDIVTGNGGDLDARELAARRQENAAKKIRARPKTRDQI
jgi:hypothetical protein